MMLRKSLLIGSGILFAFSLTVTNKTISAQTVIKEQGVESQNEKWAKQFPYQYETWKKTRKSNQNKNMRK
ncbi:MAG: hypothetical protein L3J49_13775, partial [Desulfobulbaceae bacterium]|nr:hypothetical protein [Desulfobulbaceae bacterium]